MRFETLFAVTMLAAGVSLIAHTQEPKPHDLTGVVVSSLRFKSIDRVRQLNDGRVLVNDGLDQRLVALDPSLEHAVIVLDTAVRGAARGYGTVPGWIVPYRGDTTLFGARPLAFLLIDPRAGIRTLAPPSSDAIRGMSSPHAGFDFRTGVVYASTLLRPGPGVTTPGLIDFSAQPDSDVLIREDLLTHRVDTVAFVLTPRVFPGHAMNPVPISDDWAVTSDGTVAVVRAHDLHIDWITSDDHTTASRPMAYPWRRLSDDDKALIVDSVMHYRERNLIVTASTGGGRQGRSNAPSGAAGPVRPVASPDQLPDYGMPFSPDLTRADAEGNVWIARVAPMPASPTMDDILARARVRDTGPQTYDIVNRAGAVINRVTIPGGCSIVGFGPGVVYLSSREGDGVTLSRGGFR